MSHHFIQQSRNERSQGAAYARAAEFWQERVRMMRWWADELDRPRAFGRVARIPGLNKDFELMSTAFLPVTPRWLLVSLK